MTGTYKIKRITKIENSVCGSSIVVDVIDTRLVWSSTSYIVKDGKIELMRNVRNLNFKDASEFGEIGQIITEAIENMN